MATTYGPAYLFGIDTTLANVKILSDDLTQEHEIDAVVTDETGRIVHRRLDDLTQTRTITARMASAFTVPTKGGILAYRGVNWEVSALSVAQQNADFRVINMSLRKNENVTVS
jgi:hypothetical protein